MTVQAGRAGQEVFRFKQIGQFNAAESALVASLHVRRKIVQHLFQRFRPVEVAFVIGPGEESLDRVEVVFERVLLKRSPRHLQGDKSVPAKSAILPIRGISGGDADHYLMIVPHGVPVPGKFGKGEAFPMMLQKV